MSNIANLTAGSGLSRKERRRIEDRQDIVNAAMALFAQKGFERTTLEDIASLAQFGKGTVYTHFDNKEDILRSILEQGLETLSHRIAKIIAQVSDPAEKLRSTVRAMLSFFETNKTFFGVFSSEWCRFMLSSTRKPQAEFVKIFDNIVGQLENILDQGISSGSFQKVASRDAAYLVLGAVNSQVDSWLHSGAHSTLTEKGAFLEEALLAGLEGREDR